MSPDVKLANRDIKSGLCVMQRQSGEAPVRHDDFHQRGSFNTASQQFETRERKSISGQKPRHRRPASAKRMASPERLVKER